MDEKEEAKTAKKQININLNKIHHIVVSSGIGTIFTYYPPPAIGGLVKQIDVFQSIFQLYQYKMQEDELISTIERSLGVYKHDQTQSILRTINPFFWLSQLLVGFISFPFKLIGMAGFNQEKAEESFLGKLFKFFSYLITISGGVLFLWQGRSDIKLFFNYIQSLIK